MIKESRNIDHTKLFDFMSPKLPLMIKIVKKNDKAFYATLQLSILKTSFNNKQTQPNLGYSKLF